MEVVFYFMKNLEIFHWKAIIITDCKIKYLIFSKLYEQKNVFLYASAKKTYTFNVPSIS